MRPSVWFFKGFGLDERLSEDIRAQMRELGRTERWGHSGEIHGALDEDTISLVLRGNVWADDGVGARRILLKAGDVLGGLAGSGSGVITAHDETEILRLGRSRFDELIAPHVGTRKGFVELPVAPLLYTTPTARVARALMHWVQGLDTDAELVTPRVATRALGRLVGLGRARAHAALEELDAEGAIVRKRARLHVRNAELLERRARGS